MRRRWPFRLGRGSRDGLLRRRGDGLVRLLHVDGEPVVVAAAQPAPSAWCSPPARRAEPAAEAAIARMRFATGVDDDLRRRSTSASATTR